MSNESSNQRNNNEVDLIELYNKFCSWVGKIVKNFIIGTLVFFYKHRYAYLFVIVVSVILAIVTKVITREYYVSEMIVKTARIPAADVIKFVNDWNYKIDLGQKLLSDIKSVKCTYLLDYNRDGVCDAIEPYTENIKTDTAYINNRMPNYFCVQATVYNIESISLSIEQALLYYLSKNEWITKMNKLMVEQQKSIIARIDKEIATLDSLEKHDYFNNGDVLDVKKSGNNMFVVSEKKLYHNDILMLLDKKNKIEQDLSEEPFQVVQSFSIPRQEQNNLVAIFKKSFLIVFCSLTVFLFIFGKRKRIMEIINTHKD